MSESAETMRLWAEAASDAALSAICGVKVSGLDRVPRSGSLIVACNHVSWVDPPLLAAAIAPARHPLFLGKKELVAAWPLAWLMRRLGVIPLDRGAADHSAMRAALETLRRGESLAIFPEGTRVRPGEARPPKLGVAFLSARTGAPVVPVRVLGTARFPRGPIEARFGAPLAAPAEGRPAAVVFARAVMDAIEAL